MMNEKPSIFSSFFWKLMERSGVSVIHFVIQIVLARLLDPEHYGVLAIMMVFITIANQFIQDGFQTALVQNKDVTEEDYSSVLWLALFVAAAMYGVVFFGAPLIAVIYEAPGIEQPLRVLALMLFPGALNLVQQAKVTREMDFKKVFYSSTVGALLAGGVALVIAFMGGGLWALVVKSILDVLVASVIMFFTVPIRLRFTFNIKRIKVLFSFGWKLLASTILGSLYDNLSKLIIGKKYSMEALGHYEKGNQFPLLIINTVNEAVEGVMLPAMSAEQEESRKVGELMRNSIMMSSYLMVPMMVGLAAVAEPLVRLMLTEKWLPCVPYLQMCCLGMMTYQLDSCNLQAVNAMGRSDIFLKLEIVKKVIDVPFLLIAVFCFQSPLAIAAYEMISGWAILFVNAYPNKKLVGYSGWQQVKDILPTLGLSALMCMSVMLCGRFCMNMALPDFVTLVIEVALGVVVYVLLSVIFKPYPYRMALEMLKKQLRHDEETDEE